jgi:hypothetical protein
MSTTYTAQLIVALPIAIDNIKQSTGQTKITCQYNHSNPGTGKYCSDCGNPTKRVDITTFSECFIAEAKRNDRTPDEFFDDLKIVRLVRLD